jgi:sporulation protein YlmC with PRC-barrel domain
MLGGDAAGGSATGSATTDMAAAPAEPAPDASADAAAGTDTAANAPIPDASAGGAAGTDSAASGETATADATGAAPADAGTSTDTAAAESGASTDMAASLPGSEAEFIDMGEGQIRASTMLGKEVFGQDEDSIGEVADLVLQDDGQTRAAIIDVGGFLGVGEKRVAIPFNEIQTAQEGDNVKLTVAMSREQLEQAPEYVEPDMAAASTDTATAPATDMAAGTAGAPATDASGAPATDMAAAPAGGATDPNAPASVQSGDAAGTEYELASQELTADNLIGSAVYSPNEDNLGEVNDVVFDQAGTIQGVVIDVGGFLGVGEKPVAVQYDALNVQKEDNGDLRIVLNATQEQLEGAPAFDEAPAQ